MTFLSWFSLRKSEFVSFTWYTELKNRYSKFVLVYYFSLSFSSSSKVLLVTYISNADIKKSSGVTYKNPTAKFLTVLKDWTRLYYPSSHVSVCSLLTTLLTQRLTRRQINGCQGHVSHCIDFLSSSIYMSNNSLLQHPHIIRLAPTPSVNLHL